MARVKPRKLFSFQFVVVVVDVLFTGLLTMFHTRLKQYLWNGDDTDIWIYFKGDNNLKTQTVYLRIFSTKILLTVGFEQ